MRTSRMNQAGCHLRKQCALLFLLFLLVPVLLVVGCDEGPTVNSIADDPSGQDTTGGGDDGGGDDGGGDTGPTTGTIWSGTQTGAWQTGPSINGANATFSGNLDDLYFTTPFSVQGVDIARFEATVTLEGTAETPRMTIALLLYGSSFGGQSWLQYDSWAVDLAPEALSVQVFDGPMTFQDAEVDSIKLKFLVFNENQPVHMDSPKVVAE